jgi:DNA-binding response OmpR family regulator
MLNGKRILVAEDEYLPALELQEIIENWGGTVIGPVARLEQAMSLARTHELDGAILDVMLARDTSFPVADELIAKGVPVVFATGYDVSLLPERFRSMPKLSKPYTESGSARLLRTVFA